MRSIVFIFTSIFCLSVSAEATISKLALLSAKYDFRTVIENDLDMEVAHLDYDPQDEERLLVYFRSSKGKACYRIGMAEITVDGQDKLFLSSVERSMSCDR